MKRGNVISNPVSTSLGCGMIVGVLKHNVHLTVSLRHALSITLDSVSQLCKGAESLS
eukprot:m.1596950 g.1596950  ORF g.1596950 m.1596950 type:complete len:57 (+) comp25343_c2_seq8:2149-2319(+)